MTEVNPLTGKYVLFEFISMEMDALRAMIETPRPEVADGECAQWNSSLWKWMPYGQLIKWYF